MESLCYWQMNQTFAKLLRSPLNQSAQDLLMKAPAIIDEERLKELHIGVKNAIKKVEQPA